MTHLLFLSFSVLFCFWEQVILDLFHFYFPSLSLCLCSCLSGSSSVLFFNSYLSFCLPSIWLSVCLSPSLWVLQLPAHRPTSYPSHCCPRARTPSLPLSPKNPMSWSEQRLDIATKQSLCPLPTVQAILSLLSSKSKPFSFPTSYYENWQLKRKRIMHLCYLSCINYISGWSNSSKC